MDIFTSLGVDETIFYQFAIFTATYFVLSHLVFRPYYAAYHQRTLRTVGNYDQAERMIQETKELETQFEKKAKQLNTEFRSIYDKEKSEALRDHEKMLSEARAEAKADLEKARGHIAQQLQKARVQLTEATPEASKAIVHKILGKELNG